MATQKGQNIGKLVQNSFFLASSSSLAFMLLLENTRRARSHMSIAFMQVTTVVSEHLSDKDKEHKCCLPCTPHDE